MNIVPKQFFRENAPVDVFIAADHILPLMRTMGSRFQDAEVHSEAADINAGIQNPVAEVKLHAAFPQCRFIRISSGIRKLSFDDYIFLILQPVFQQPQQFTSGTAAAPPGNHRKIINETCVSCLNQTYISDNFIMIQ